MKISKLLFLLAVLTLFSGAHGYASNLNLSIFDGSVFTVSLGEHQYNSPVKEADFKNIPAGSYYLKIERRSGVASADKIYEGYISIPDNYTMYSAIDESGNFVTYKKLQGDALTEADMHGGKCDCDCEFCKQCKYKHDDRDNDDYYHKPIREKEFSEMKKLINDRWFESTKLDFAKDAINENYFTVDQVREVLGLFSFENTKLDLAELMYSKTCDKKNYYKLYDIFSFESNVEALRQFINSQKHN